MKLLFSSWAFVYFPLVISSFSSLVRCVAFRSFLLCLLFHRSRVLLGAWRFGLFRCVYSSVHYKLDLIREPAFYWVFYFIFPV